MERVSFVVRCRRERRGDDTRVRVVRIDQGGQLPVRLDDASFLIRFFLDDGGATGSCSIRHIASGREVYLQSGAGLGAFIKECLQPGGAGAATVATGGRRRAQPPAP